MIYLNQIHGECDVVHAKLYGVIGRGVTNAEINEEGHLIFTLSDKTKQDMGKVVGEDGNDYVLTEQDKQDIADMVHVEGGGGDTTALEERIKAVEDDTTLLFIGHNNLLNSKQNKLTAGANITIENNVISATGGGSSYDDGPIKERIGAVETRASGAESRITAIEDKEAGWDAKQDALTAGYGIKISENVVAAKISNDTTTWAVVTEGSASDWGVELSEEPTTIVHKTGDIFKVTANVDGATSYEWQYSRDGETGWTKTGAATASEKTLITSLNVAARRWYRCQVWTDNGTVITPAVDIARNDTITGSLKGAVEYLIDSKIGLLEPLAAAINEVIG